MGSDVAPYNQTYAYNAIGNMTNKAGVTYTYPTSGVRPHAVTSLSDGSSYGYDANGNMTTRVEGGITYQQTFDAENRLVSVTWSGQTTTYTYDGDGRRVKKVDAGGTTYYVGSYYELKGSTVTTYYYLGGQRVAMKVGSTIYYLHGDHLGSTSLSTSTSQAVVAQRRYYPYGEFRWVNSTLPTDYTFTGQRQDPYTQLIEMGVRWYHPRIGRWISPDSIIPGFQNPQNFNRYSYVRNNALRYVDPSGHQGTEWEKAFEAEHGRAPNEQDRWDYEFCQQVLDFAGWEATFAMRQLLHEAGITLESTADRRWTMRDMDALYSGVNRMADELGGPGNFRRTVGDTVFKRVAKVSYAGKRSFIGAATSPLGTISVYDAAAWSDATKSLTPLTSSALNPEMVVHELAHRWSYNHGELERGFEKATGGSTFLWKYKFGSRPPTENAKWNRSEDFADSIMYYLFRAPELLDLLRTNYVRDLFNSPP